MSFFRLIDKAPVEHFTRAAAKEFANGGYMVVQELPFLVLVFGIPAIAALLLTRKASKTEH